MVWSIILSLTTAVQGVFTLIALISASDSKDVLKSLYWTKVHGYDGNAYWGLFTVYEDTDFGSGTVDLRSGDCVASPCDSCNIAGQVVTAFLVLCITGLVITLLLHTLRGCTFSWNSRFWKNTTIVTAAAASISASLSIIIWGGQCQANIYNHYDGDTITMGPAYGLMLAVVIVSIISLVLDLMMTAPDPAAGGLNAPLNPSAPYAPNGTISAGVSFSTPYSSNHLSPPPPPQQVVIKPPFCSFCGHKACREHPTNPEEVHRFCHVCGRRHIVEEGLRFCQGCGTELKF